MREVTTTVSDLQVLGELLELAAAESEDEVAEVAESLDELESKIRRLEVARMLQGAQDASPAIVTIHPGAGGVDAQDWAEMLMRMYLRWADQKGYKVDLLDKQQGDEAGLKDVSMLVSGDFAYGFLRAENGVHRLIRISPFDSNARRHTAFAAVFVVPDLEDDTEEVEINPDDLRVDTFRASGKGGQHVNKTESAIRITHLPTNIVVQCQAERSQHKNRSTAMKMLRGRLYERARQEQEAQFASEFASTKTEIGFGSQVRTYTLAPYQMVKDERTDYKTSDVEGVLSGSLDPFIEAFLLLTAKAPGKSAESD